MLETISVSLVVSVLKPWVEETDAGVDEEDIDVDTELIAASGHEGVWGEPAELNGFTVEFDEGEDIAVPGVEVEEEDGIFEPVTP